jgi:hypothetical protein
MSREAHVRFCESAGVRLPRATHHAIFCTDRGEAYRLLVFLAAKLANEGLVLQKRKTRILSAEEFRQTAQLLNPAEAANQLASEEQKLLNISIRYDPYSPTAAEDYEELREAVNQIDILGILGREIAKPTIDAAVSKQAIQAIMVLPAPQQEDAIRMLLDSGNLVTLAPVFVVVMRVIREIYRSLRTDFQSEVDEILCDLYSQRSPLLSVEVNLSYYLQTLAGNQSQRKEEILVTLFQASANPIVRRIIILTMAKWSCFYWLSDVKNKYGAMSLLEKRAFLLASYYLGDEGKHWRDYTRATWAGPELFLRTWFSQRFQTNKTIPI